MQGATSDDDRRASASAADGASPDAAPEREGSAGSGPGDAVSRALDTVLARFTDVVRRLARQAGLDADDADDLQQELRIRLWRSLGTSEKIRDARALYIRRAATSATLDLLRRRRARRERPLDGVGGGEEPEAPGGADRDTDQAEFDAAVARAIGDLTESRRVVVRLYLAGYGREEIAEMLGWTEPKTRNLLYRGLGELREALERAGLTPRGYA